MKVLSCLLRFTNCFSILNIFIRLLFYKVGEKENVKTIVEIKLLQMSYQSFVKALTV